MASLLSTGVSALNAYQTALRTTGHNIANVDTEGYSRQVVDLATRQPERQGPGWVGQGVDVAAIRRQYDDFLAKQVRSTTSSASDTDTYYQLAAQLDSLVADADLGLAPVMQRFFDSLQALSDDPSSIPVRQVVLAEASALADRFRFLDDRIKAVDAQVNAQLESGADEINALAQGIADLNNAIANARGTTGSQPNDLLDQREQLVVELSEFVNVSTVEQDDGALNVFIGSGQALVLGVRAATLGTVPDATNPNWRDVTLTTGSSTQIITSQLSGGTLGGALRFRNDLLSQTRTRLDDIATGLHDEVNAQHALGLDLEGDLGGAFFALDPLTNPAAGLEVVVTRTQDIAAAGAVRAGEATDPITGGPVNTGTGAIGQPSASAATGLPLGSDVVLSFSANAGGPGVPGFTLSVPGGPLLYDPATEAGGKSLTLGDLSFEFKGIPDDGDQFVISDNTAATGDNRNALALADLQSRKLLDGGTATLQSGYAQLVSDVGARTSEAGIGAKAQAGLLENATLARSEVSGVNLDEEAANLLRFQQAYQAAAQVISVAQTLFDTLIGAVRR